MKRLHLVSITLVLVISFSCRKENVEPTPVWSRALGTQTVSKELPSNIARLKPSIAGLSIPNTPQVLKFGLQRNGTQDIPTINTLTGSLITEFPSIVELFTKGNPNLSQASDTTQNITVTGWIVNEIQFISDNGATLNVTNSLDTAIARSLSQIITFYSDGFYTFINTKNQEFNELGWYQISVKDDLPIGIIYNALATGSDFKKVPKLSPIQSMGIWGIDKQRFFPLLQLSRNTNVFLETTPVVY